MSAPAVFLLVVFLAGLGDYLWHALQGLRYNKMTRRWEEGDDWMVWR